MSRREHWRGILEWNSQGLHMTTPSNDACKMYDAVITQFVGWYDDENLGGIGKTLKKMLDADPSFVMGHCLEVGLLLNSTRRNPKYDNYCKERLTKLLTLKEKTKNLSPREIGHIEAVRLFSLGNATGAAQEWEKILIEYPNDMHAIRLVSDIYLWQGSQREMRDTIARVLPFWQSGELPLKEYLYGMYAFGLCETNFYDKAEAQARKGLKRIPQDGWATHALAHVYEMQGRASEGDEFLYSTEKDWKFCNHIAGHNYWHQALFKIELNAYDQACEIMEDIIMPKAKKSESLIDIVDLNSLLYRLNLTGPKNLLRSDHWNNAMDICKPYFFSHGTAFNDAHYVMACLGSGNDNIAEEILESLKNEDHLIPCPKEMVESLLKAMISFKREKYANAVELLLPVRYKILKLGGSEAQRDVFNQLLIVSAIKSKSENHRKLAEHLLNERDSIRPKSHLDGRLVKDLNQI